MTEQEKQKVPFFTCSIPQKKAWPALAREVKEDHMGVDAGRWVRMGVVVLEIEEKERRN